MIECIKCEWRRGGRAPDVNGQRRVRWFCRVCGAERVRPESLGKPPPSRSRRK